MRLHTRHAAGIAALMAMGGAASCGVATPDEQTETDLPVDPAQAPSADEKGSVTGLRAAYIAAVQSRAGEEYHAERGASGEAVLVHPPQGFAATLDGAQVRLTPGETGGWELSLTTTAVGCETRRGALLPAGVVETSENRVRMSRGDVEEWYVNGPLGLEQGFTLERAPSCEGTKVVSIEVGGDLVPGLVHAEGSEKGTAVTFSSAGGGAVARYSDLHVKDARGKILEAWMALSGATIELHVDDAEAVYPLEIDPLVAVMHQKLTSSDVANGDNVGHSIAISGDTAVVGAFADDVSGNTAAGSAYVFVRSGGVWTEQQKLVAGDGAASDYFGRRVAISGDTVVVGVRNKQVGVVQNQGAAYVYARSGTTWTQQQKLVASDGYWQGNFGSSVAISGDDILVGAEGQVHAGMGGRGGAYVFTRSGGVWTEQQKLVASDGTWHDNFGSAVAIEGDTAIVGAYSDDHAGFEEGSAYVFTRGGTTWTEQQKLVASDASSPSFFGNAVALSGDTALVGAYWDTGKKGAVYVFNASGGTWSQAQKITASDGAANDLFGYSLSLLGDVALVGAYSDDVGSTVDQGSAYLFHRAGGTWTEQQKITAGDGAGSDWFGIGVGLGTDVAIIGAPGEDYTSTTYSNEGAIYVFTVTDSSSGGTACTTGTECGSGFCVDGFCCDTACGGNDTSDCQACSLATGATANGTCTPLYAGTICRASGGVCDIAEVCDGVSGECPSDTKVAAGTNCRTYSQVCDVPEACDGVNAACPPDGKQPAGTLCRPAVGPCDVPDYCDGVAAGCYTDAVVAAGTPCRASAGACDPAESCNGYSGQCPTDVLSASGTVCRASTGSCDPAEACTGTAATCPADVTGGSCGTPVCVTIRRGVNGAIADSYLSSVNGGWGPGSEPWMTTGGSGVGRSLVRFDLSSVPSGATVTSATVTLHAGWNESNTNVRAHKVLNSWAESTVSYNNFWSSSNFDSAVVATFNANGTGNKTFSITALASEWVSGASPNHGILLEEDIGVSPPIGRHTFYCSEGSTITQRPALEICYLQ